ncbi:MAG: geranylgeranyl reductase family protein [Bacteroidetes bacterium]|nr:geranylgeranyl reductase family protein [Bacteroidota bacterium]
METAHADYTTTVLIAGAGPAGASTAIFLAKEKISHIIIDKASFPRDKVCGDAISGKSLGMLRRITDDWEEKFVHNHKGSVSNGIRFVAPNGKSLDVPFSSKAQSNTINGFVSRRMEFDNNLVKQLDTAYTTFLPQTSLEAITETPEGLLVTVVQNGISKTIFTQLIVGAEGRSSMVAKKLAGHSMEPAHFSAGIRAYYQNVKGLHTEGFIELHFIKAVQPGYVWIFPLPNGACNVGVGMLSKSIAARKANLRQLMQDCINTHPQLKERFAGAVAEGPFEGWGLPLGSKKRKLSGNRFILTGDAASLIDPFTGEGIGNAMVSGLVASRTIAKAVAANEYSAALLSAYDAELYNKLWAELKLGHYLQTLSSKPALFNFVVSKALKSKSLRDTLTCMFENVNIRKQLTNPLFYLRILFNR